uniref:uncharacterized protein LOC120348623 isoform X1 n=2 Tax=Styela clava TaxID=7725 RepID=UPI00193AD41C|nr:uncharacterized protein LOC120348623 isoform X1 [Styela clava]
MDSKGDQHILLSPQDHGKDMYKLTYDSDDNDEVVAPKSPSPTPAPRTPPPTTENQASKMKVTVKEINEKGAGDLSNSQQKRTKDAGTYQGNGRFYSLFANDNFVTEDPKQKKRSCCVGWKTGLLIATVIVLAMAILGMMWVVRGMQVEQNNLRRRVSELEDEQFAAATSSEDSTSNSAGPASASSIEQPPPELVGFLPAPPMPHDQSCCAQNQAQIDYLNKVLKGQSSRFENIESQLRRHIGVAGIRESEVTRELGENFAETETALSMISSVKKNLQKVSEVANAAQTMALFAMSDEKMDKEEIDDYLKAIVQLEVDNDKDVAFGVAHAARNSQSAPNSGGIPDDQYLTEYYDISAGIAPMLTFTQEIIDAKKYIQPEIGNFRVPSNGNYVIFMNFCIRGGQTTSVHLMRNQELLREMEVTSGGEEKISDDSDNTELLVPPPAFQPPPLPVMNAPPPFAEPPRQPPPTSENIRPYQFSEVVSLEEGDTVYMKIYEGSLVEYNSSPAERAPASCTRFSGYKLN